MSFVYRRDMIVVEENHKPWSGTQGLLSFVHIPMSPNLGVRFLVLLAQEKVANVNMLSSEPLIQEDVGSPPTGLFRTCLCCPLCLYLPISLSFLQQI